MAELDAPPVVGWREWYARQWRQIHPSEGQHILFDGPTRSGKTVLCRMVARLQAYVLVLGTKPRDPSLDAYLQEGYTRIDHWPPTRDDVRKARGSGATYSYVQGGRVVEAPAVRFILWPKITERADLTKYRNVYAKALDSIFVEGNWCVVMDEGLWLASRKGLNLGDSMAAHAYASAGNNVSMYLLVQRPANLPPDCWTNVMQALIFHGGHPDDVRKLASLSVYDPREVQQAIRRLRGHQFLDLPCRGGAEWAVSEVDPKLV